MASVSTINEEGFLKLRIQLSARIGSRRFSHTLGVEEEIIRLGKCYLPEKISALRIAALLHDLTKEWTAQDQFDCCRQNGIALTKAELSSPRVLHAKTGAIVAEKEFAGIVDPEILHAIEFHTTGDVGMTVFDELLYLADYIEPTRTYPECITLRRYFWDGYETATDKLLHLHKTVAKALSDTVAELNAKKIRIFPATERALADMNRRIAEAEKD